MCSPLHPVALLFSMGGVALVSFSSMDNPDEKGVIGKHGDSDQWKLCFTFLPDGVELIQF